MVTEVGNVFQQTLSAALTRAAPTGQIVVTPPFRGEKVPSRESEHPDLADFRELVRRRFQETLEYEQEAALLQIQRMATLRDRLLDVEDAGQPVRVWVKGAHLCEGILSAVGQDHVELGDTRRLIIPLTTIEMVELT